MPPGDAAAAIAAGDTNQLRIRLTGQGFGRVLFGGSDRFFSRTAQAEFQFARAPDGRVVSLTFIQRGRELLARRVN